MMTTPPYSIGSNTLPGLTVSATDWNLSPEGERIARLIKETYP